MKPTIRRPVAISPTARAEEAGRTFESDGALDATEPSAGKPGSSTGRPRGDCGVVSGSRERRSRSASTINSTSSRNETTRLPAELVCGRGEGVTDRS